MIQKAAEIEGALFAALDCASPKRLMTNLASLLHLQTSIELPTWGKPVSALAFLLFRVIENA